MTGAVHSRLMRGTVGHERLVPRRHAFDMASAWCYLDMDELPDLFAGSRLWSVSGQGGWPTLQRFRRSDYLDGPGARTRGAADSPADLAEAVLARVEAELGRRPDRPRVRLLSQVRSFGYVFNPVSFYFVLDEAEDGSERVFAVLAEITNTPWGQRHAYVFDGGGVAAGEELCFDFAKRFHVSPFFDMQQLYRWRFRLPSEADPTLAIHMTNVEEGREVFHAGMRLEPSPVTVRSLRRAALDFPWKTLRVHAAIYVHAALLWLKRVPFFTHPDKRPAAPPATGRP
jgi:hypothetical protein